MNLVVANRIYNLVSADPVKIAILKLLADGNWHTRFEVESLAKDIRPTIGLVGICTIIKTFQDADAEIVEIYNNDSGVFYRLNPERLILIKKIIAYLQKSSNEPPTNSTSQYRRFKEQLKSMKQKPNDIDDDLKQFL